MIMVFVSEKLNLTDRISASNPKLNFLGARYEKDQADLGDSIRFICKNHRQTRRNPNQCAGSVLFSVFNRNATVLVDRLIGHTLHDAL